MILTCPECATRYFVEDERLGDGGRTVRCGSCGAKWAVAPEAPLDLVQTEFGAVAKDPASEAPEPAAGLKDLPAEELPKVFRGRAQTREKVREAATSGVVWAGLVAGFLAVIAIAVLLRQDISQIWPRAAGAYAMVGLPVNLAGLAIEDQHAQPALKDGHAVLSVSGALRNVRGKAVAAPPLRISVLDNTGKTLAVKIADPGGALIPPGEARRFMIDVVDPPQGASDVDITFVLDGRRRPAQRPTAQPQAQAQAPASTGVDLRPTTGGAPADLPAGPVPNAAPLPRGSPYALPNANPNG